MVQMRGALQRLLEQLLLEPPPVARKNRRHAWALPLRRFRALEMQRPTYLASESESRMEMELLLKQGGRTGANRAED